MRNQHKALKVPALLLGLVALLVVIAPPVAAAEPRTDVELADEAAFLALANQARAAAGMGALAGGVWIDDARAHSEQMAASGSIFHDPALQAEAAGFNSCWFKAGENVGRGGNPDVIHAALMNSATHRTNILGNFESVGVGVERTGDTIYVTQRFMKPRADCGAPAPVTQLKLASNKPPAPSPAPPAASATPKAAPVKAAPAAAPTLSTAPPAGVLGAEKINDCVMHWCWFRHPALF